MVNDKIINACLSIISKHDGTMTLYELFESEICNDLTFYEAEIVSQALDYFYAGVQTFIKNSDGELQDTTPYDVVSLLRAF